MMAQPGYLLEPLELPAQQVHQEQMAQMEQTAQPELLVQLEQLEQLEQEASKDLKEHLVRLALWVRQVLLVHKGD
jgi:predicted PhzF superfamily epimerase YddE/YHI9